MFYKRVCSLEYNGIGKELECICDAECLFNRSLPQIRTSFYAPLVAMVCSSRTTAFVAKYILVMLESNRRKIIGVFDATLFPPMQNGEENVLMCKYNLEGETEF